MLKFELPTSITGLIRSERITNAEITNTPEINKYLTVVGVIIQTELSGHLIPILVTFL